MQKTRNAWGAIAPLASTVVLAGTAAAIDYDPTGQAGQYDAPRPATLIRGSGGSFAAGRVYVPVILDESDGAFNAAAVQVDAQGVPFGAVTTFASGPTSPPVRAVFAFGTTDASNPGFGSNDAFISEGANGRSNSLGALLPDGTLVWRANYFSTAPAQNNLEFEQIAWPQNTPNAQITTSGMNKVFGAFPGIDSTPGGTAQLGTPGADRVDGVLYTGVTAFDAGTGAIPTGVNVYTGGDNNPNAPLASWLQLDSVVPSFPEGGDVSQLRQTQPVVRAITLPNGETRPFVLFGVGLSGAPFGGGSARPLYFVLDEVDSGAYSNGFVTIEADGDDNLDIANPDIRFVDHQATGGGGGPFVNSQFDINASGQVVAVVEDSSASPFVFEVRLYNPVFSTAGDAIIGYEEPIIIARSGEDGIVAQIVTSVDGQGNAQFLDPVAGAAIDNSGLVAFVAVTEVFDGVNPSGQQVLFNTTNDVFVWEPCTETLHSVLRGGQNGDALDAISGPSLQLGIFPVGQASDGFSKSGLSDEGRAIAVVFRDGGDENGDTDGDGFADMGGTLDPGGNEISVRGVAVLQLGDFARDCADLNGDGIVNFGDLNAVLNNFGQRSACIDLNGDGVVNFGDLNTVLNAFGQPCN